MTSLDVEFTPSNVSGDYIDSMENPADMPKTLPLTFEQRPGSSEWVADLPIKTRIPNREDET